MQISGEWYLCDDGVARPVISGEIQGRDGSWWHTFFLVDTGADRTVFDADTLTLLGFPSGGDREHLGGVGGTAEAIVVDTQVRLVHGDGGEVVLRGQYAALTSPEALDMNVLGRDITGLFAVLVDRPTDRVYMVGQRHRCRIERT